MRDHNTQHMKDVLLLFNNILIRFNDKKSLETMFCSVVTKNSNWEILTKNLVAFKR